VCFLAGAFAISELCIIGKPVILVPSPFVAEDHQTKNAMALVSKEAALLVKDADAGKELINAVFSLFENEEQQQKLASNIKQLAKPNATEAIVDEIEKLIK